MRTLEVDVAIIGTGTSGMTAYRAARQHTARIVSIESGPYGTTCARVGCMPSKLLIAAADVAHSAENAALFGVSVADVEVDPEAVMQRVRGERDRFAGFAVAAVERWPAEHKLRGRARFVSPHELQVDDHTRVIAQRVIIATGSSPIVSAGWRETLGERLVTSDDVFYWQRLPASVCVVGAGVIGLELSQALHRLGVRTRTLGRRGKLAHVSDPALKSAALDIFGAELPSLVPDAQVLAVARHNDGVQVRWSAHGREESENFDLMLSAIGRSPNLHDLNLAAAGIEVPATAHAPSFDPRTGQIGNTHVFIAGDAAAERPLLHEAADMGRIAGDNAGRFPDVRARPRRAALSVIFSDPQICTAGADYAALTRAGVSFDIGEASFEDQGRSRVMARNRGLVHVYGDRATGRFLGAEMIGPAAEHIGHLLAWSAQHSLTVQEMLDSPFYHPVVEEGLRTALRDLAARMRIAPPPAEQCLECGPGA